MKLSKGVRYALRMMVAIAKNGDGSHRVTLSQVAQSTQMPRRYLEQLAIPLRRSKLLIGRTGRGGGYVLAQPPGDIRVRQIVESVVGPMSITTCSMEVDSCNQADGCECRVLYTLVNDKIAELFDEVTLADLVQKSWKRRSRLEGADPPKNGEVPDAWKDSLSDPSPIASGSTHVETGHHEERNVAGRP